jgi:hypothetical protein
MYTTRDHLSSPCARRSPDGEGLSRDGPALAPAGPPLRRGSTGAPLLAQPPATLPRPRRHAIAAASCTRNDTTRALDRCTTLRALCDRCVADRGGAADPQGRERRSKRETRRHHQFSDRSAHARAGIDATRCWRQPALPARGPAARVWRPRQGSRSVLPRARGRHRGALDEA